MFFKSNFFRLTCSLFLLLSLSILTFADTIRLKDGSIIKGKITNFTGGKFVVAIGEGSRQRQMSFSAEEIESISFDAPTAPTSSPKISNQTNVSLPVAENRPKTDDTVITVGENSRTSTPSSPPQIIKTDNTAQNKPVAAPQNTPVQNAGTVQNSNPAKPAATAVKAKPIELNVKVLADNTSNGWTNSGFVVRKGQKIRIAGDGRISLGAGRFTTPSGVASLSDNDKLMKAVATGALIAVIGDDNNEFIYVGAEREFTASRDGSLFLGVNEGNLNDNSGAFDVKIEIDPNLGN
jgi:hypothetical protein